MSKSTNLEIIKKHADELYIDLSTTDMNKLETEFTMFNDGVVESINNFDLNKYQNYNHPIYQTHNGTLRADQPCEIKDPFKYLNNASEVSEKMVVIKNEK